MGGSPGNAPTWPIRIVVDGQSLAFTNTQSWAAYWRQLRTMLGVPVEHCAVGGQSWTDLLVDAEDRWATKLYGTSERTGLVMFGGQGDLVEEDTAEQIYADAGAYAAAARVFGFEFVVCLSIPEIDPVYDIDDTERQDFNTLLLSDPDEHFDGVVDLSEIELTDGFPVYYLDNLHLEYEGARIAAAATAPVVLDLITPPPEVNGSQLPGSMLTDGIDTAASTSGVITNIPNGSSNVYGTITLVDASTSADAGGIWFSTTIVTGTNRGKYLQFMTGASSSEVEWATVLCGYSQIREAYFVPGFIPSGTRISAKFQSVGSGTDRLSFRWGFMPVPDAAVGTPVTMGVTGSNTRGISLTAPGGLNSKGAWTEIEDSTTDDICALMVCLQLDNATTIANANMLVDIGVGSGGNEVVIIPDIHFVPESGATLGRRATTFAVEIPAGSRIAARYQRSDATNGLDLSLVGATVSG